MSEYRVYQEEVNSSKNDSELKSIGILLIINNEIHQNTHH